MKVDDELIEETKSTKFLGIHLDRELTWNNHIDSVCSRVNSGIYALRNLAQFCSLEVLRTAYYGLIHTHLEYGIRLWGSCSKYKLERVFRLQKRAVRTILKLQARESYRGAFRELGLLTLPCLYILEVALYCRSKCALTQGRDVHSYETRGRDNYRTQQHRSAAFERLPSQVGVKIINGLPKCIKNQNLNLFKTRLKHLLVSSAFYTVDEFFQCRWDNQ
uniref:Reverse transcriptase domain-containing protein n=1 Tax=Graphocephala atropunctata TaxID=36148 RepID=A0A1B6MDI5_9HEMI